MKKIIILLSCVILLVSLVACTGKPAPGAHPSERGPSIKVFTGDNTSSTDDNTSSDDPATSGESNTASDDPATSGESNTASDDPAASSKSDVKNNKKTTDGTDPSYKEMPQKVLDYLEANAKKWQYEYSTEFNEYRIYDGYFECSVDIGALLDITDEKNPIIIYLEEFNLGGSVYQDAQGNAAPFEVGFAMKGTVAGVKLDDNGNVLEFYSCGEKLELYNTMVKQAYTTAGLAPD